MLSLISSVLNFKIDAFKLTWIGGEASHTVILPRSLDLDSSKEYELALSQVICVGAAKASVLDIGCSLIQPEIFDETVFPSLRRTLLKKGSTMVDFAIRDYARVASRDLATLTFFLRADSVKKSSVEFRSLYLSLHLRQCHI